MCDLVPQGGGAEEKYHLKRHRSLQRLQRDGSGGGRHPSGRHLARPATVYPWESAVICCMKAGKHVLVEKAHKRLHWKSVTEMMRVQQGDQLLSGGCLSRTATFGTTGLKEQSPPGAVEKVLFGQGGIPGFRGQNTTIMVAGHVENGRRRLYPKPRRTSDQGSC